jgi:hypothetical protein
MIGGGITGVEDLKMRAFKQESDGNRRLCQHAAGEKLNLKLSK